MIFLLLSILTTTNLQGAVVDLGYVGPGQTIPIYINPIVNEGGKLGIGGRYDYAEAIELPEGWSSKPSKLYGNPLMVTIKTSPDSKEQTYYATIRVVDEDNGERLGNITFKVKINVKTDVMNAYVDSTKKTVNVNQPARFHITVENLGSAADTFIIEIQSPNEIFKRGVYIEAQSSKTIRYEFISKEEETVPLTITVYSTSSDRIKKEFNVEAIAKPDLLADYRACANGIIIYPIFEAPIQLLGALISNLFSL